MRLIGDKVAEDQGDAGWRAKYNQYYNMRTLR